MPTVSHNPFHGHAKRGSKPAIVSVPVRSMLPGTAAQRAALAGAYGRSAEPMSDGLRERTYLMQTGRRSMTPRQRRRYIHKSNRAVRQVRKYVEAAS